MKKHLFLTFTAFFGTFSLFPMGAEYVALQVSPDHIVIDIPYEESGANNTSWEETAKEWGTIGLGIVALGGVNQYSPALAGIGYGLLGSTVKNGIDKSANSAKNSTRNRIMAGGILATGIAIDATCEAFGIPTKGAATAGASVFALPLAKRTIKAKKRAKAEKEKNKQGLLGNENNV